MNEVGFFTTLNLPTVGRHEPFFTPSKDEIFLFAEKPYKELTIVTQK